MSISQVEVAKHLGISQRSVSAAIRNDGRVSESTRQRVLDAATRLGYRPNAAARATRRGRFGAIGLVRSLESAEQLIHHSALIAIERQAAEHHLQVVSGLVPESALTNPINLPRILREWSVDGMLASYAGPSQEAMRLMIEQHRIPAVWINQKVANSCVRPDDFQAALDATRELIALGHRRITMIQIRPGEQQHYSRGDRDAGYERAMDEAGLTPDYCRVSGRAIGSGQVEGGYDHIIAMLSAPDRPTAVLTAVDVPTVTTVFRLGLAMPRDLSLVAIRDKHMAIGGVEITGYVNPMGEVGKQAVEMLYRRIKQPDPVEEAQLIPFRKVQGQTVAALA